MKCSVRSASRAVSSVNIVLDNESGIFDDFGFLLARRPPRLIADRPPRARSVTCESAVRGLVSPGWRTLTDDSRCRSPVTRHRGEVASGPLRRGATASRADGSSARRRGSEACQHASRHRCPPRPSPPGSNCRCRLLRRSRALDRRDVDLPPPECPWLRDHGGRRGHRHLLLAARRQRRRREEAAQRAQSRPVLPVGTDGQKLHGSDGRALAQAPRRTASESCTAPTPPLHDDAPPPGGALCAFGGHRSRR